jgi:DNA (cytosine-5)-methyltransferase 1
MARAGLGSGWSCQFANDFDAKKAASYRANWGGDHLKVCDVASLSTTELPGHADLAWASFPCQDLSLAGAGAGLQGERSGTFWPFWKLISGLKAERRAPRVVVLENVCGALTSNEGKDFASIGAALAAAGYRFGALVVDAVHFLPQSRPRLFIVAVSDAVHLPQHVQAAELSQDWHTASLAQAQKALPKAARDNWIWWRLPKPPARTLRFSDVIEGSPQGVKWHQPEETEKLLNMMSDLNRAKVYEAQRKGCHVVGTIYKRTRPNAQGVKVQRAEVRFDDIAGCLRTPAGGSSRQTIMVVQGDTIRSRLLSPREAARLMGLPDAYQLPEKYNDAYHLAGDGVAVPAVRFLARAILEPLLSAPLRSQKKAA